jgi:peptidoglycan/LPS O-acetylase OafA/YrhL
VTGMAVPVLDPTQQLNHPVLRNQISRVPYLPGLDGLRALAVAGVMVYHANHDWLSGGFLGVEVFFVISGYLITLLLVSEKERNGKISLKKFWMRRARRLLPALYAVLCGLAIYMAFFHQTPMGRTRGDFAAGMLYGSNWFQIWVGQGYTVIEAFAPLRHLWSLAVEEQFYLVWPLVMALVLHRKRDRLPRVAVWLFILAIGIAVGTALLYSGGTVYVGANPVTGAISCAAGESHGYWHVFGRCVNIDEFLYLNTLSRAGGLMLGAAFALVWRPVAIMRGPLRRRGRRVDVAAILGLGGIGYLMYARFLLDASSASYDEWLFRGGFFVTGLCTLLCIAAATHRRSWIGRLLGIRPLNYIGTRSYGLYLFHWPIYQILRSPGRQLSIAQFGIAMLITIPVTELSYRIIELPVRQGRLGEWIRGERKPRTKAAKRKRTRGFVVGALVAVATGFATVSIATASVKCEGQVQCDSQTGEAAIQAAQTSSTTTTSTTSTTTTTVDTKDTVATADTAILPTLPGATESPTTPAPTTAAPTTTNVLDTLSPIAIGESVMLGAAPELTAAGIRVDAVVSRQGGNTANVIANYRAQGQLGRIVIIQTGTNGFVMDPVLDQMMASLPPDKTPIVVFLTVRAPRRWIDPNNARIRALPKRYPNVRVLDWAELSHQIEGQFAPDGYHLGSLFAKQFYANAIFDAIGHPELKK